MSSAVDYAPQYNSLPHRKPLNNPGPSYPSGVTGNDQIYTRKPSHTHTRSASSSALPPGQYPPQSQYNDAGTRRTLSNATSSSTGSSGNTPAPVARVQTRASMQSSIHRSISSRSQQQPATSYVALLRRQKATVWCDHAQHEDPRVLAQQRQAKARANMHLAGGIHQAGRIPSSGGGGVRSKIRHHGAVKASAYQAGNMAGAGVPMRLSASEVDDGDSDDERLRNRPYHTRNESGRSSLSSGHRASGTFLSSTNNPARLSVSSTPSSRNSHSPSATAAAKDQPRHSTDGTPVPAGQQQDYFARTPVPGRHATSTGSGSSSEERGFGESVPLPVRVASTASRAPAPTADELRRRGSVDERTTTMTGVRLFVANPDLSD